MRQHRAFVLVAVAGLVVAFGAGPRESARSTRSPSSLPRGINPNVLAGRDPVRVARFDAFGTVAAQREAHRVGSDRLKANVEYWRYARPAVNLSAGSSFVTSTQRTDQFTYPQGGGSVSVYPRK